MRGTSGSLGLACLLLVGCSNRGIGSNTNGTSNTNNTNNSNQPVCGNGIVEAGEECDDGPANNDILAGACRTNCRLCWLPWSSAQWRRVTEDSNQRYWTSSGGNRVIRWCRETTNRSGVGRRSIEPRAEHTLVPGR